MILKLVFAPSTSAEASGTGDDSLTIPNMSFSFSTASGEESGELLGVGTGLFLTTGVGVGYLVGSGVDAGVAVGAGVGVDTGDAFGPLFALPFVREESNEKLPEIFGDLPYVPSSPG